jgi:endonuclease-3 related protein
VVTKNILMSIYNKLYKFFGPQHWWPAKTKFEVMVGAILTQNTAWQNVEKAIKNLRKNKLLSYDKMLNLPYNKLASLIKSCGYYNIKSKRVKNLLNYIRKKGGLDKFLKQEPYILRKQLLSIKGIGEETADSILLYAANLAFFVVDAYTKRILLRHKLVKEGLDYASVQKIFMDNLEHNAKLFNEYHALLVKLGKEYCRKKPLCKGCPLKGV